MPVKMAKDARRNKRTMSECFDNFYQELDTHSKVMTQIMSVVATIQPLYLILQNKIGGPYQA